MKASGICPKCGSEDVIANARVRAQFYVVVEIAKKPNSFLNKQRQEQPLRVWVCGSCGFTELWTEGHSYLWSEYEKAGKPDQSRF